MTKQKIFINQRIYQAWFKTQARYIVAESGRGAGKSTQFGIIVILESLKRKMRILCIRGFQNTLRDSSLAVLKKAIELLGVESEFYITENGLRGKNGSEFIFTGAQNPYSWKSIDDIDLVFIDEATELKALAWEILLPTIREGKARFLIAYNPTEETDPVYVMFHPEDGKEPFPDSITISLSWQDNPFFEENQKVLMDHDKRTDYAKYLHIWEGQLRKDTKNALFKKEWIRYTSNNMLLDSILHSLEKIVIAVDPSTTSKETSDECGLVVCGKFQGANRYIVLQDETKIQSPDEWAREAISLYKKYSANFIVYEKNQGGDMVKTIFNYIDPRIPVKDVWAKKGKLLRAEPVAVLYQRNLVEHYRIMPTLEGEMITFKGKPGEDSPNSLDAMVYGMLELIAEDESYSQLEFANSGSGNTSLIDPLVIKNTRRIAEAIR